MMGKEIKIYRYQWYVVLSLLLLCLRLSSSHANVLPAPIVEDQGVDLNVNVNAAENGRNQGQSLNGYANPHSALPTKHSSPDEGKAGVMSESEAAGSAGSFPDGKTEIGNANDLKPTKDDWYYDPADEEGNEETWGDERSYEEEEDLDTSASDAPPAGSLEGDEEDDDDEDETNYELWAKLHNSDKQQNDVEEEEGDDGAQIDQDVDEKLLDDVVDEDLVKKNKLPTAPSKMVLFYTWMILAVLIMVIGISTYQARCRSLHLNGFRHQTREDRKRLVDHEYT